MGDMELRHCRYFEAIAQEGNLTRAAQRLHVSQPALSKQLKQLEAELGATLFEREHQGVRLTDAGQTFLVHARDLMERASAAMAAVGPNSRRSRTTVIVGYSPLAMPDFLGAAIKRAKSAQVGLQLKGLLPPDQIQALRKGALDIALLGNPPAAWKREFATRCLNSTPIVAALPEHHRLARSGSLDLAMLSKEEFVGFTERSFPGRNECVREACLRAGFIPTITSFADSLAALTGMVAGGAGVALAPAYVVSYPLHGVKIVEIRRPRVVAESIAAWRKARTDRALEAAVDILAASADASSSRG